MSIKTTHFRDMSQKSEDIFEATLVIGKRARQIITERIARNEIRTFDSNAEFGDGEDLEELEPDINYVERTKPTTEALGEFLDDELEWTYGNKEGEKSAEE
ncbi:MAG: DNA-directed RNA polymerase subunit omega [Dehalococcoidia bacterium]|nr:DNA-directed RNA polymerase subunit omega [Dehalococcoidia bacterium]